MKLARWLRSLACIALLAMVGAWFLVKPIRALVPTWVGITCPTEHICVESVTELANAQALYDEAYHFVLSKVGPLHASSRVIFCRTDACASIFGLGARSAVTVGTWATVIGPRAWKPYYVRHELIHVLQGQTWGVLALLAKPEWFKEGMAYSLSEDPRRPLASPHEDHRKAFEAWNQGHTTEQLWTRGKNL